MTPIQYLIVVANFTVLSVLGLTTIHETGAIREELAEIKKFQQAKVAPLHEQMNEKLDRLTTGHGGR